MIVWVCRLHLIQVTWVLVGQVLCLSIQLWLRGLMGGFLCQIHGCRVLQLQGTVFLSEYRDRVRANGLCIE
jgi:hypothetical protein